MHEIPLFLDRSIPLLTPPGIEKLQKSTLAVAGCGGVGAALAITMARSGVKHFRLADPGIFDEPDCNRQWGASQRTLGRKKVDVYREMILDINPEAEVVVFDCGITPENPNEFLEKADVLIDCLDVSVSLALRDELHDCARSLGIFGMTAPIIGFGCVVACSDPNGVSMKMYTSLLESTEEETSFPEPLKKIFMPEHLDLIAERLPTGRVPSLAVAPLIATSLLATEATAYLLDGIIPGSRTPIVLPKMMFFDLYRMRYVILDAGMLG